MANSKTFDNYSLFATHHSLHLIASLGRINPVHVMLRTGTDAYSGGLDHRGIRAARVEAARKP